MSIEINKRTQCGYGTTGGRCQLGIICDKRAPPNVLGNIHKMVVQPAMLCGMETVPVTSSNVRKLEVTEMKMCRWACGHTLRDNVRNDDIRERLKVEKYREVHESKTAVVWPCKEARPKIRRKKDYGHGTTWEKEKRKTEAEMDGLCQPRHGSHRNDER